MSCPECNKPIEYNQWLSCRFDGDKLVLRHVDCIPFKKIENEK